MAACSKGGQCSVVLDSETATEVVHRCTKCGTRYTRPKGSRSERVGRAYALALLAMVTLAVVLTIWAGVPA